MKSPRYALVTPARNEAKYIRFTLESVVAQTHKPERWVVISDGSTDATDDIVREYMGAHPFIRLTRREPDPQRNFGSKVRAIEVGIAQLGDIPYEFVGNLDGDVSFSPDYYEQVLARFAADPKLGVAGGILYDDHDGVWRRHMVSVNSSVGGPVQLFRRECYEQIGGYRALQYGGVDAVAEGMARMHGWRVRTFPELVVRHHRRVGTQGRGVLQSCVDLGRREHVVGYHPLFGVFRAINRMRAEPYVVGGVCYAIGFYGARLRGLKPATPDEYVRFLRREQLRRLIGIKPGN